MVRLCLTALTLIGLSSVTALAQAPVGLQSRSWIDNNRLNLFTDEGGRPLDARIWYPALVSAQSQTIAEGEPGSEVFIFGQAAPGAALAPGRHPLIALSHGNGGSAMQLMWLAQALAEQGYVVAAVNHHGNTAAEPELLEQAFATPWERAFDLSVLIDQVLGDPVFGPSINPEQIGVGGFSIGGFSALVAAGGHPDFEALDAFCASENRDATCGPQLENPEHSGASVRLQDTAYMRASKDRLNAFEGDDRIRAVFLIAPALGAAFERDDLTRVHAPIALAVGDADRVAPAVTNAATIAERSSQAQLSLIEGGVGHYTFLAECGPIGVNALPDLCQDAEGVDRAAVHAQVAGLALDHFKSVFAAN